MLPIYRKRFRVCDLGHLIQYNTLCMRFHNKFITMPWGLLTNYCFLVINYCYQTMAFLRFSMNFTPISYNILLFLAIIRRENGVFLYPFFEKNHFKASIRTARLSSITER